MINRTYVVCETCEHKITARVVIGGNTNPIYTFPCPNCSQDIQLGLEIDYEKIAFKYLYISNCKRGTEEGTIVNLSAEIAIGKSQLHKDLYFPTLFVDRELYGTQKAKSPVLPQLWKNWKALRRAWSLSLSSKNSIAERFLAKYTYFFGDEFDPDLNSQIYNFTLFFLVPTIYKKVASVLELLKAIQSRYFSEYAKFVQYYAKEYQSSFSKRFLDLYADFMINFDTLFPILMYMRIDKDFDSDLVPTSFNFDGIKMFYGNTFEILADLFVIPSCINNIYTGRSYNQFLKLDLAQYLSLDKAARAKAFQGNPVLRALSEEFNNSIRNASHHGNIEISGSRDQVICRHGRPPKETRMTLTEYVASCDRVFLNTLCLLCISLFLVEHSKLFFRKTGA